MEKKMTFKNSVGKKITAIVKKIEDSSYAIDYDMKGITWQIIMNCPFIGGSEDFPIIDKEWNKQTNKRRKNGKKTN